MCAFSVCVRYEGAFIDKCDKKEVKEFFIGLRIIQTRCSDFHVAKMFIQIVRQI
jgi:hypothetical protein